MGQAQKSPDSHVHLVHVDTVHTVIWSHHIWDKPKEAPRYMYSQQMWIQSVYSNHVYT